MSIIDSLRESDGPTVLVKVQSKDLRAAILALEDAYKVLAESGQLEVNVPESLTAMFEDEMEDEDDEKIGEDDE